MSILIPVLVCLAIIGAAGALYVRRRVPLAFLFLSIGVALVVATLWPGLPGQV